MCVILIPGFRMAGLSEACMCWICACTSACVSECIMALCMTISNDSAIPPCWLLLFICRGEIIPFHLLDSRNECVCTVVFHSLCCTWNQWIIFPFCCADVPANTVFHCIHGARIVLITIKAQRSESKKDNWHPAEKPLSSISLLNWAWRFQEFSMQSPFVGRIWAPCTVKPEQICQSLYFDLLYCLFFMMVMCAVWQIISFPYWPINESFLWLWTWGMH